MSGGILGRAKTVYAVDGISFDIARGETLALVGESGCGKSTVGKAVLRLFDITAGQIVLDGKRIDDLSDASLRPLRRRLQVVFQDPFSSLNPRQSVREAIAEPLRNFGLASSRTELNKKVGEVLDRVKLPATRRAGFPTNFPAASGNELALPGLSLRAQILLSATKQFPRSTSPSRRKS